MEIGKLKAQLEELNMEAIKEAHESFLAAIQELKIERGTEEIVLFSLAERMRRKLETCQHKLSERSNDLVEALMKIKDLEKEIDNLKEENRILEEKVEEAFSRTCEVLEENTSMKIKEKRQVKEQDINKITLDNLKEKYNIGGNVIQQERVKAGAKPAYKENITYEKIKELQRQGLSVSTIAKKLNTTRPTIYARLKEGTL